MSLDFLFSSFSAGARVMVHIAPLARPPARLNGARQQLTNKLREQGRELFTPTLTGLGERAHLGSDIRLSDYVEVARRYS